MSPFCNGVLSLSLYRSLALSRSLSLSLSLALSLSLSPSLPLSLSPSLSPPRGALGNPPREFLEMFGKSPQIAWGNVRKLLTICANVPRPFAGIPPKHFQAFPGRVPKSAPRGGGGEGEGEGESERERDRENPIGKRAHERRAKTRFSLRISLRRGAQNPKFSRRLRRRVSKGEEVPRGARAERIGKCCFFLSFQIRPRHPAHLQSGERAPGWVWMERSGGNLRSRGPPAT